MNFWALPQMPCAVYDNQNVHLEVQGWYLWFVQAWEA